MQNTNAYKIAAENINYSLEYKGKILAEGSYLQRIDLPASGEKIIDLPLTINLSSSFAVLKDFLFGKENIIGKVRITGDVTAGFFSSLFQMTSEKSFRIK